MNPLAVVPFLAWSVVATLWPGQVDGHRHGRSLLIGEVLALIGLASVGYLLSLLVDPRPEGLQWGRAMLIAAVYLYVCGRGLVLVRAVLDLPALRMRRDDDRTRGAIEVARGRAIGVLERALLLTFVFFAEYGAVGFVVAAKSLARFKALEDREFAEYFLIGTLASLLLAVLGGVALRALLA